jgi:hypothetical protein
MNRWRNDFLSFSRPSSQTYNEESRVEKLRRDKKKKKRTDGRTGLKVDGQRVASNQLRIDFERHVK